MDIFNEFTSQQYSDFSFICSSELRLQIILRLLVQPLTPGELTDSIGMTFSQISRALGELLERKLVHLLLYPWDKPRILSDNLLFGLQMSVENAEAILVSYCDVFFRDALVNQIYASKTNEVDPSVDNYHYNTDIPVIDIYGENILSFWESWTNWFIDPTNLIPLFATEDKSNVVKVWKNTKGNLILQINPQMENTVMQAVKTVEEAYNTRIKGFNGAYYDGLIYMVYIRKSEMSIEDYNGIFASEIIPLYIGKTETLGRSRNFSKNLLGVGKGNNKQYFTRWGYDEARHMGGLSYRFFGIKISILVLIMNIGLHICLMKKQGKRKKYRHLNYQCIFK